MVTPLTELAVRRALTAPGGLQDAAIDQAMALVAGAFDTDDLRGTRPADPTQAGCRAGRARCAQLRPCAGRGVQPARRACRRRRARG
jgi:hypothetical protein